MQGELGEARHLRRLTTGREGRKHVLHKNGKGIGGRKVWLGLSRRGGRGALRQKLRSV